MRRCGQCLAWLAGTVGNWVAIRIVTEGQQVTATRRAVYGYDKELSESVDRHLRTVPQEALLESAYGVADNGLKTTNGANKRRDLDMSTNGDGGRLRGW
jgi:hypothetical protein